MQPTRIHHVQITVSPDEVDAARAFYCDVLGLPEIEKPESLQARGGFWMALGDQQIHVGIEDKKEHSQTKAHIAYEVVSLGLWREQLADHDIQIVTSIPIPGYDRFEFRDPFGNRVEMIQRQIPRPTPDRQAVYSGSPWEERIGYARAVRVGNVVHVAGTTANTPGGDVVGATSAEQARYIFQKIERALQALDLSLKDVVRTRMFVVDIDDWEAVGQVHHEFFKDVHPVATMVEVSRLIGPDYLIEIEVEAERSEAS